MSPVAPFRLLAISDRHALPPHRTLPTWAATLSQHGVPAVQVREKDLPDGAQLALLRGLRGAFPNGKLLANGRADVAIAAGADGVHLPADGLPTAALRARFPLLLIGRSTHTLEEVIRETAAGADYVTFGPIFATHGKGAPAGGLEALARAAAQGVPVLALGGVRVDELSRIAATGAAGAAGIRLFLDAAQLPELVARANEAFAA